MIFIISYILISTMSYFLAFFLIFESIFILCYGFFFNFYLFMIVTQRKREREREAETQAEGEAGSMHQEPDVGFDHGSSGSRPGPKAGDKRLRHPGIPLLKF